MKGVLFQLKRYTASEWSDSNPVLLSGEPGIELQEDASIKMKFGNGVDNWNDLPYFANSQTIPPAESGSFKGTCDTHTDPGTPTTNEWWSATEVGVYPHFGDVEVLSLDEVFNYIKWDGLAETWSIEIVPVNMAYVQIPKVVDGVWDLNVTKNLELEVNPYRGKVLDNAFGRPYFYLGTETPTLHVRLNLEGDFAVSKLFAWALNLPNIAPGKWLTADENNNIVGSDAPSGGVTPADYTFEWDVANSRYAPYAAKKALNPGYPYFYAAAGYQPSFGANLLLLDGTLKGVSLVATSTLWVDDGNAATGSSFMSKLSFTHAKTYGGIARSISMGIIDGYGSLSAKISATGQSVPVIIGTKTILAGLKNGEFIEVDDYNQRFDINMTKIRLNKLTASKMLVTDANKEIACIDMPDFTLAKFYTDISNQGANPTDAYVYTLPANTLNANGKQLDIITYGSRAANSTPKSASLYFGNLVVNGITTSSPTLGIWKLHTKIIRISSTEIKLLNEYWIDSNSEVGSGIGINIIGSIDFTTAKTIKLILQGGAENADITAKIETIKLYP